MTPITEDMYNSFNDRTIDHIKRVNYFGNILGYDFSDHDKTKWDDDKINGFILSNAAANTGIMLDDDDLKIREKAIFSHVKSEPHHPSYWDENCTFEKYYVNPKGFLNDEDFVEGYVIDATKMDKKSIVEMCSDWCAVSDELGTDPHKWAEDNIGTRWLFTEDQKVFLNNTLNTLWTTHQKNKENTVPSGDNILNLLMQKKMGKGNGG